MLAPFVVSLKPGHDVALCERLSGQDCSISTTGQPITMSGREDTIDLLIRIPKFTFYMLPLSLSEWADKNQLLRRVVELNQRQPRISELLLAIPPFNQGD